MRRTKLRFLLFSIVALAVIGIAEDQIRWNIDDKFDIALHDYFNTVWGHSESWDQFDYSEEDNYTIEYSAEVKSDSIVRVFYDSGQVKSITELKNEIRHGGHTEYFENGQVKLETYYVSGRKDGEEHAYYPDGTTRHIRNYKMGRERGKQQIYDKEGKLTTSYTVDESGHIHS